MTIPAPLVPSDCDLRGLPWMPLDTVRLMDSDINALATGEQFRAAVRLWCKAWHQVPAGSLPSDDRILAVLSGYGTAWKRMREVALRGFVKCSDGRLYHPVICEKAIEAWEMRKAQRERAHKRWHSNGSATAMPRHSAGSPEAMLGTGTIQVQKEKSGARKRATPLPEGFAISSRVQTWAKEKGFGNLDLHLEHFIGYAKAKEAKYADWDEALMNAIRADWGDIRKKANGGRHPTPAPKAQPCANCKTPLTGGWSQSPKGRVCDDCHRGYMRGTWPEVSVPHGTFA